MKLLVSSCLILGISRLRYLAAVDLSDLEGLDLPDGFGDIIDPQATEGDTLESNPCNDIVCQNDAECENVVTTDPDTNLPTVEAVCNCKDGYEGNLCEIDIDECELAFNISSGGSACNGRGTCHNNINSYFCQCNNGYSGDDCEIDDFCTSKNGGNPCHYGNACEEGVCICNGPDVTEDANQKKTNGIIQFDETDTHPNNALGFYTDGEFCEDRDYCSVIAEYHENDPDNYEPSCGNMSFNTCVNRDTNDGWVCSCNESYLGHYCQYLAADVCPENYCGDHGNCNKNLEDPNIQLILADREGTLVGTCFCDFGYFGDRCQNKDQCAFQTCNDRGTCTNVETEPNYVCNCDDGYDGHDCEFEGCDPDSPTLFKCDETYSDTTNCSVNSDFHGICPCLEAPERTDCDIWGPLCHSSATSCHPDNTESCDYDIADPDTAICTCKTGFYGDDCSLFDGCMLQEDACNNLGSCADEDDSHEIGYTCACVLGYAGVDCEYHVCDNYVDENLCDPNYSDLSSCKVDDDTNTGVCPCLEAPDRTDCDVWGPLCHSSATNCHLDNTESCDYDIADPDTAICTCKTGFLGDDCSLLDGCAHDNPCSNRGSCVDENDDHETGYTCTCDLGYAGVDCEYHVCDEDVAENLCDPDYSDLSSCTVDADSNTGVCQCLEAPERTDCDLWGPVCHSSVAETCSAFGTESCDYNPDNTNEGICTCKAGYLGGRQLTLP